MDDILASIRKIISEDEARAQARPGGAAPDKADPDVLLLTDLIDESGPASGAPPEPAVSPPAAVTAPVSPAPPPATATAPPKESAMPDPIPSPAGDSSLVARAVAGAASSAFARLNQVVQESVPVPAATDPGPAVTAGGKTIEELVKEMLRPMLKEWLDSNLPSIVERYVEREVVRLTRR